MALYFLLLDGDYFEGSLHPALTASWRSRSFAPCRELCQSLLPRVADFDSRYHIGEGEPLVRQVVTGLPFERDFWRALVGELLFYAADVPEISTCPDTLRCLIDPDLCDRGHFGSRPLSFGLAVYRPGSCGWNDRDDVRALADYLASVDPPSWRAESLTFLPPEEREEELAVARDWFPLLRDLYRGAASTGQVVVSEIL